MRKDTIAWYEAHARELSLEGSLEAVLALYRRELSAAGREDMSRSSSAAAEHP
jgi:hypothetical protein